MEVCFFFLFTWFAVTHGISAKKPNLVFILTDDQDMTLGSKGYSELGSLEAMPITQKVLLEKGAFFSNFFVNTPICCPSRTEFMSGRYYHNIGPPNDPGGCMHVDTKNVAKPDTGMFGLLRAAGYNTGAFGKITNDQKSFLPLIAKYGSIDYINSPIDFNNYNDLNYFRRWPNGTTTTDVIDKNKPIYGTTYQTTQLGNRSIEWIEQVAKDTKPFFAYIGPHAPHYPAIPAPWNEQHSFYSTLTAPITPNYNLSSPGKAQHVRQNPPFTQQVKCWEDQHFADRWVTLVSVDDLVGEVVATLERLGVLENTYIFYSSDHGYKQGQWRIGTSKQHPYETDIRVPLLVRGPGIKPGSKFPQVTGNVDLLPTLLDLAGDKAPKFMDGKSMKKFLVNTDESNTEVAWRDRFLHEYMSVGTYYNDHSNCWQDGKNTTQKCGGGMPRDPLDKKPTCKENTGVGDGNCYYVDSKHSNNWRALRIINKTTNLIYVEYDPTWEWNCTDDTGAGLQHYELYDIDADPYQMINIYNQSSDSTRRELHLGLATYYECKGTNTTQSNCI